MKNKPGHSSSSPDIIEAQLARGLRGTSGRLESGFDALEARMAMPETTDKRVERFPQTAKWWGGSLAAALILGIAGHYWMTVSTQQSSVADNSPVAPAVVHEMLSLDAVLGPARPLLESEIIIALLEMPYESNTR